MLDLGLKACLKIVPTKEKKNGVLMFLTESINIGTALFCCLLLRAAVLSKGDLAWISPKAEPKTRACIQIIYFGK